MSVCLLLGCVSMAIGHDFEVDGIYYNYNDDGISVIVTAKDVNYSWLVYKDVVSVPEQVTYGGMTYTVTGVDDKAFYSCQSLKGVELPSSITVIGVNAFASCPKLQSVNLPSALTAIGDSAFLNDRSLSVVALGPNVTFIGRNAYTGCSGMVDISVDPGNPAYDSRESCNAIIQSSTSTLLYGCKNTTIPSTVTAIGDNAFLFGTAPSSLVIPGTIKSIGDDAFMYCSGLTDVTLTDGVERLGARAFSHCTSLMSMSFPASLSFIGAEAFSGCWSLIEIVVDEANPTYDSRGGCNALIESATGTLMLGCQNTVMPQGITAIGPSSFAWSRITAVNIPEGVTTIGDYAFDHCYYITELTLPSTLVSIGYSAFNGAYANLTTLTLPNSLTSLGGYAFACCSGLEHIDFGEGLQEIGDHAFFGCRGLTSLNLPNSLKSIGDDAFMECSGLTSFTLPAGVTHVGCAAFQACENLTRMSVAAGSETFDSREDCNGIIETATNTLVAGCVATVIPNTVTALDNGAFMECIGLSSIVIPPSVTAIGDHTFELCYYMDTIILPPHLQTIGKWAFAGCEKLVYMRIPSSVTMIDEGAFYDCPWLNYITLGRDLTFIGNRAFDGCNFITVACEAMEPPVIAGEDSFWHYGNFSDAMLKVPGPALERYRNADYWKLFPLIVVDGDLNGDGRVGMDDLTAMIGFLLGNEMTSMQLLTGDMNNDFELTMDDLTVLINRLLTEPHGPMPPR